MDFKRERPDTEAIRQRRAHCGIDGDAPVWGLALSGGGIRSATFCFGLLRALAARRALQRFDYLSTVSGGGYIGAALGRLYQPGQGAAVVQDKLASERTLLLHWLRNNGRYLTPAGMRDLAFAVAGMLRGALSSNVEAGLLFLLFGGVLLAPAVLAPVAGLADAARLHAAWGSFWWWLVLPVLAWASAEMYRYWGCRTRPERDDVLTFVVAAVLAGAAGFLAHVLWREALPTTPLGALFRGLQWCGVAILAGPVLAWPLLLALPPEEALAKSRLNATRRLSRALVVTLVLLAAGALDLASRALAGWAAGRPGWSVSLLGLVAATGTVVRLLHPVAQRLKPRLAGRRLDALAWVNVAGLLFLVAVVLFWLTLLQYAVHEAVAGLAVPVWGVVLALCAGWVLWTGQGLQVLNHSSLHNFYRARILRAYVSVGNAGRASAGGERPRFEGSVLSTSRDAHPAVRLNDALERDDVPLADYLPHRHGGPIHLINCCINQTVDDRNGTYSADRKGIALTVSALGVEIGTQEPPVLTEARRSEVVGALGTLSQWIAVSGAAAGTGMGSRTAPGVAALLFLSGLRLGWWTRRLREPAPRQQLHGTPRFDRFLGAIGRWLPKPTALLSELLARFPGLNSAAWYLSDGGHFENTGVYPLLKRRADVVVVADCGADPDHLLGDLENLARKALIDHATRIEFLDPADLLVPEAAPLLRRAGTPAQLAAGLPGRCFALAALRYDDHPPGLLVVVKPARLPDMPLELERYAAREAVFPQQSTGDQFFDEAQWEAYHQLGWIEGLQLDEAGLEALARRVRASAPAAREAVSGTAHG
ncbi:MAG TPA: patatin-like phospholipase family protein [Ramlibacter sp.]|jgi:hypothetical protein|uniref:patatin-like phospholipase family protein n=1 Tax=Ramlibacter sp. TaxID=1917967 RepID=UPI002D4DF24A|nr:patatin-like phospholipase family protein [Ramlibacter sp.]HZY18784.1 patatin-like phospholipase family protein [Ramlibacter sp.]